MENNTIIFDDLITRPAVRYLFISVYVIFIIFGGLGNASVIIFLLKGGKLKSNVTAFLVLNLSVCELLVSLVYHPLKLIDITIPFFRNKHLPLTIHSKVFCQLSGYVLAFFACCAFHTITAISLERLILIRYPLKAKSWLSIHSTKRILLLIWLCSLTVAIPIPIFYTFIEHININGINLTFCSHIFDSDEKSKIIGNKFYFIFLFIFYYIGPVIIITVNYTVVFKILYKKVEYTDSGSNNKVDPAIIKATSSRRSLAKMMVCIAVLFTFCNGPFFCTFLYICFGGSIPSNSIFIFTLIDMFSSLYGVVNPIIYGIRPSTFKKAVSSQTNSNEFKSTRIISKIRRFNTLNANGEKFKIEKVQVLDNNRQLKRRSNLCSDGDPIIRSTTPKEEMV